MGFVSFLGRLLFVSLFIISARQAYNEFNDPDGGTAAKDWAPKVSFLQKFLNSKLGEGVYNLDVKHFVISSIVFKVLGCFLFVFGSSAGAFLLMIYLLCTTPLFYDFYNYESGSSEFLQLQQGFVQRVALFGALLFFVGMKNSISRKQQKRKAPKAKAA